MRFAVATFIVVLISLLISAIGTFGPFGAINGNIFRTVEVVVDKEEVGDKQHVWDPRLYAKPIGELVELELI